jgi:hypothetical protein
MGTSFITWAQQSRFYLMMETDSSLQNVVYVIKALMDWDDG